MWFLHIWIVHIWIFHVWIVRMWVSRLRLFVYLKEHTAHPAFTVPLTVSDKVAVFFKLAEC